MNFHLFGRVWGYIHLAGQFTQGVVIDFRSAEQVKQTVFMGQRGRELLGEGLAGIAARLYPGTAQTLLLKVDRLALGAKCGPALVIDQTQFPALFGQTQIGVVFAQHQPVFRPGREHAIGLAGPHGDQVIDQYADVGFIATRTPGLLAGSTAGGIHAGEQTLGCGFFVTGGAVDLAGEEQTVNHLGFQRVLQILGIEIVVFDGITGAQYVGVLHAFDRLHHLQLDVERQRGGYAVGVQLMGGQTLGLDKDLVLVLVSETVNLVLDGRAVARAHPFDHTGVHRRAIQVVADDLVGALVGVGNPAIDLLRMLLDLAQK